MRLSHEIIVLDYGDEQSSPFDNIEKSFAENRRDENDNGKFRITNSLIIVVYYSCFSQKQMKIIQYI